MTRKLTKDKEEQQIARTQRQDLKAELTQELAKRPRKPYNRRRRITFIVFALLALLAALFSWLVFLPSPTDEPGGGIAVGAAAPYFNLPIYGGAGNGSLNLLALRGHPVVINFWSESCPPCRLEVPLLEQAYSQFGANGEFTLIGINQADPKDDIRTFGTQFRLTYPLLFDESNRVNETYGVTAIPTTYFIDSSGIVRTVFRTQMTTQMIQQGLASVGIVIE
jgi:cytochrome c biogenesis protein CcmG, thiol:disulfide interchange protein DsbE